MKLPKLHIERDRGSYLYINEPLIQQVDRQPVDSFFLDCTIHLSFWQRLRLLVKGNLVFSSSGHIRIRSRIDKVTHRAIEISRPQLMIVRTNEVINQRCDSYLRHFPLDVG